MTKHTVSDSTGFKNQLKNSLYEICLADYIMTGFQLVLKTCAVFHSLYISR